MTVAGGTFILGLLTGRFLVLSFYTLFNFYVFTLAILFLPSSRKEGFTTDQDFQNETI